MLLTCMCDTRERLPGNLLPTSEQTKPDLHLTKVSCLWLILWASFLLMSQLLMWYNIVITEQRSGMSCSCYFSF